MKKLKRWIIGVSILAPTTALAFMGIGDSGDLLLGKILAEMTVHTTTLKSLLQGVDFANALQTEVRRGIDDPLELIAAGLPERDAQILNEWRSIGPNNLPIIGKVPSLNDLKSTVEKTWGPIPRTAMGQSLSMKDYQAIYSLGQAASISGEASGYFEMGQQILDDLEGAHEGKATVRNAQSTAVQVQQLSQIEANQGLQISLQAQELLARNETHKGLQQFNDAFLQMLQSGFASLTPMGPR